MSVQVGQAQDLQSEEKEKMKGEQQQNATKVREAREGYMEMRRSTFQESKAVHREQVTATGEIIKLLSYTLLPAGNTRLPGGNMAQHDVTGLHE